MAGIYTVRFLLGGGGVGDLVYTVPTGKTASVKGACFYNNGGIQRTAGVTIAGHVVALLDVPANAQRQLADLFLVAYAGETIAVSYSGTEIAYLIAGFLFPQAPAGLATLPNLAGPELPAAITDP